MAEQLALDLALQHNRVCQVCITSLFDFSIATGTHNSPKLGKRGLASHQATSLMRGAAVT